MTLGPVQPGAALKRGAMREAREAPPPACPPPRLPTGGQDATATSARPGLVAGLPLPVSVRRGVRTSGSRVLAPGPASEPALGRKSHVTAAQPNAQQQQQAEAQRKAAQTVLSVHTRSESELEALKLCHHMTL